MRRMGPRCSRKSRRKTTENDGLLGFLGISWDFLGGFAVCGWVFQGVLPRAFTYGQLFLVYQWATVFEETIGFLRVYRWVLNAYAWTMLFRV